MSQLDLIEKYQDDPIGFMVEVLDVSPNHVWSKMVELAESVRDYDYVCAKAGNSVSKSFTLGRLCNWFLFTHYPSTVITTAPSNIQVEEILWREIRDSHANSKIPLGGKVLKSKLELGEKWFATGFATKPDTVTKQATRLQGFHNENVLIIIDEAAGVDPLIYEAIDRLMSSEGNVKLVLVGNPTTSQGNFVDCFKDSKFKKITISAFDTPNYKEGREVIPGLAGRKFVQMVTDKYGVESNQFKSMITGEIPDEDIDSLIPISWIERAEKATEVDYDYKFTKRYIVWDVADGGNDAHVIKAYENTTEIDSLEIRGKKVEEAEPYVWRMLRTIGGNTIVVDADGVGRVAVGLLEGSKDGATDIIAFAGSDRDSVAEPETFYNRRHEGHWKLRELFEKSRISISDIPEQKEELSSIKLVDHKRGFIAVEPKKLLKDRIKRSPGHSDCHMMMAGTFEYIKILHKKSPRYNLRRGRGADYPFSPQTC
jgi:phage terminase large subunit